jgi:3-methyl-2-oxobutanoate hydroxymethyltransferase
MTMTTIKTGARSGSRSETGGAAPETAATPPDAGHEPPAPVTMKTLVKMVSGGEPIACLTCYDATTARWLEQAGVPLLLVGDTAAEMILGHTGTIHAPLDFLILLTAAVKRGASNTFVMGDMPFMSYQADDAEGIRNAGRFMTEGCADAVKLEVDRSFLPLVERMARAGVPVVAHIGSRPQQVKLQGGYASAGRTAREARELVAVAVALEQAGASMLLIEAVPNEVSQAIVERTNVPVIGCGAGTACHGQIVVMQDIFGLSSWQPSFARPIAAVGEQIAAVARQWVAKVAASDLGEHPYRMSEKESEQWSNSPKDLP